MSLSWLGLGRKGHRKVAFSLVGAALTRTSVYIDGYNFYYSRLKGTPYKWLDIAALFRDRILVPQDPGAQLVTIKYFTAPVKASYARHGEASSQAQTQYLRALQARDPGLVQVINGFHIFGTASLPTFQEGIDPTKSSVSRVWMIEEKQTDVNIALHAYRDALRGECEQLVLCSNDSDLEPALRMVREDAPGARPGLVMPLRDKDTEAGKVPNKRLTALAHWVRHHIRDDELAQSQLPQHVQTRKKPASKPPHW
ncbi:NYN domain-containing protein [Paracidovorax avenae]